MKFSLNFTMIGLLSEFSLFIGWRWKCLFRYRLDCFTVAIFSKRKEIVQIHPRLPPSSSAFIWIITIECEPLIIMNSQNATRFGTTVSVTEDYPSHPIRESSVKNVHFCSATKAVCWKFCGEHVPICSMDQFRKPSKYGIINDTQPTAEVIFSFDVGHRRQL